MSTYRVESVIADDRVIVDADGGRLRLEPGDTVTDKQLLAYGQTEQDIENLIECGALAAGGKSR